MGDETIGTTTFHSRPLLFHQCSAFGMDQIRRFQGVAANNAQIRTSDVATFGSTRPEAMVVATAVPMKAPIRLVTAASMTAWRGVNTLVATTVAMELAVS